VGVHAAGNGACFFYDGHSHPFLRLRDGTHPLARRTCEPRPLVQAGQIRPAPLAGAIRPGARPTDRLAGQPGRRQPTRRSGRDPGSRPYAPVQTRSGKPGRKRIHSLPADSARYADNIRSGAAAHRTSSSAYRGSSAGSDSLVHAARRRSYLSRTGPPAASGARHPARHLSRHATAATTPGIRPDHTSAGNTRSAPPGPRSHSCP
jgi:hypothetical protein